ncbi:MAG: serine O-acetyltransferase [Rikenellaceae bacterium]|nr:serine O-acetyltransferase [Rikenellaceae bacterium]
MTSDNFPSRLFKITEAFYRDVPSTADTHAFMDKFIEFLFPLRGNPAGSLEGTQRMWEELKVDFHKIITPVCEHRDCCCNNLTDRFFNQIPLLFTGLLQDAEMYNDCDPAAFCKEEVILCYPGFYAVMVYRIAHIIHKLDIPILPRVISEYAHSRTGIDINPGAEIGKRFYIDHGTGIVIGETTVIGENVKLYQGVTLGATFVSKKLEGKRRHPTIEDNVIIYAGSTILGGDTVVGHDTVIGGNVWLTRSVPPFSKVYHDPQIIIKGR